MLKIKTYWLSPITMLINHGVHFSSLSLCREGSYAKPALNLHRVTGGSSQPASLLCLYLFFFCLYGFAVVTIWASCGLSLATRPRISILHGKTEWLWIISGSSCDIKGYFCMREGFVLFPHVRLLLNYWLFVRLSLSPNPSYWLYPTDGG